MNLMKKSDVSASFNSIIQFIKTQYYIDLKKIYSDKNINLKFYFSNQQQNFIYKKLSLSQSEQNSFSERFEALIIKKTRFLIY